LLTEGYPDTLWASGYEVYDRISPPYQKFLEGLTATYAQPKFEEIARDRNFELHPGPRGAPENVGNILKAVHPVIRTNPVTGWKSVFAVGTHCQKVDGLSKEESAHLLKWFVDLIVENHDLQVRFHWQNPNDIGKGIHISLTISDTNVFDCFSHMG
jgi:alpha-ketoglutarate-dependent taurine dioxygenase